MIEIGKMLYKLTVTLMIVVFLLLAQIISSAQNSETKDARYYSQQAMSAYREKNYSSYLENMSMALKLRPGHPTIIYNLAGAAAQKKSDAPDARALVEIEREFSRASEEKGMREAFLKYLADDGIIFRPHAVNGKKWFTEQQPSPGLLTWEPARADISLAGDLGYTTGPWEYRQNGKEDTSVVYGNYVTVWRKQTDGSWKFAIDTGTSNPKPPAPASLILMGTNPESANKTRQKEDVNPERAALLNADREFSKFSEANGAAEAFLAHMSDEALFLRSGIQPVTSRNAIRAALSEKKGKLTWQPDGAGVSLSGDLGYTYGVSEFKGTGAESEAEFNTYVRIWKKGRSVKWQVVLDVAAPAPPPKR